MVGKIITKLFLVVMGVSNHSVFSLFELTSELDLGRFTGEPDGGLAWFGEVVPFIVLEVGYSDSGTKTRNRAQHWITRGHGQVNPSISTADLSSLLSRSPSTWK